jgi:hypothetical protein
MRALPLAMWLLLALILSSTIQGADPSVKRVDPDSRVKTATVGLSGTRTLQGVVGKIDADGMVVVEMSNALEVKEHSLLPTDLLRAGKIIPLIEPRLAYRWEDVKAGDTVILEVAQDQIDKQTYCMAIRIDRRSKGRLPASQKEDKDDTFPWRRIVNDIENGIDVTDEELKKVFPARPERIGDDGQLIPAWQGGLNKDWQKKLDAIRAKKKDDVKAPPPEKK